MFNLIAEIDHHGYKAYSRLKGSYYFPNFILSFLKIQGDPFAPPSIAQIRLQESQHKYPAKYLQKNIEVPFGDFILERFHEGLTSLLPKISGSGNSGLIYVSRNGQQLLKRSSFLLSGKDIVINFNIGLPAEGRRIKGQAFIKMLQSLQDLVQKFVIYQPGYEAKLQNQVNLYLDQEYLRSYLRENGYVAFIADGAILPRASGQSEKPLKTAIPFRSPESMRITIDLPFSGKITGMAIPKGITVIIGGGFHGKSTLLKALERGVYNHRRGDGRELVITDNTAVKIRAEDGRVINHVDISPFIGTLPQGVDTKSFSTLNASGSTSQAANVIEALEAGAKLLLFDEDVSATNFLLRDKLMEKLVEKEPITPFLKMCKNLYNNLEVSTILVVGSLSDYLKIADKVILMEEYIPREITSKAHLYTGKETLEASLSFNVKPREIKKWQKSYSKVKAKDQFTLQLEKDMYLNLRYLEQLCDYGQAAFLARMIKYLGENQIKGKLKDVAYNIWYEINSEGFARFGVDPSFALPRWQEMIFILNRIPGILITY
ncbi:ABC-ATPase domain-containing protein [Carboxydothermus pertinax]|uniref:ABC-ATPase domain-containing protein n=1 Tax=Carboxydothermus pertinax TaxID=870242 RepID=UPI001F278944|nr:ABC-ATPase domain-containing protein [Carboxydothermus pertinax]